MWPFNFFKKVIKEIDKGHGLISSPTDYRDIPLGSVQEIIDVPDSYDVPYKLAVTDQGTTPHCTGHAAALMKAEKERREHNQINFDPEWLYRECKKIDGIPNVKGTYFRAVLKVLKDTGAMPVGEIDLNIAEKYRIGGYAKVDPLNLNAIKSAIYQNGVILAGFHGTNEGWSRNLKGHIRTPRTGESVWGHATVAIGFNKEYIKGQNSWGLDWGDKGMFYYNNYMPFECWAVLVDLPSDWKDLIGLKKKPKFEFKKDLRYGVRDPDVIMLQECLKWEGLFPREISTNYFGKITLDGAKMFQVKYNIMPTLGFVGTKTRSKLNEIYAN